jgi:hypothetical protein
MGGSRKRNRSPDHEVGAQWDWNDGWILAATLLVHKAGGATLAEVIAAADAVNHAIPTTDDLSRAFSRLADCGIVQIKNDRYLVARGRRRAVALSVTARGGLFSSADRCLKWLKTTGLEPPQSSATASLSDAEVRAAYESYRGWSKKR